MEKSLIASFDTYAREPILRKMKDGSLICMFLTGGNDEPANDNFVAVSRSFDDGRTWTAPEMLFNQELRGVWCTELYTEGEYPIAFVHTYNASCHYRELLTYYSESRDNGKTWSEPKTVPGHINGCSVRQGFTLSNGDTFSPFTGRNVFVILNISGFGIFKKHAGVSVAVREFFRKAKNISKDSAILQMMTLSFGNPMP